MQYKWFGRYAQEGWRGGGGGGRAGVATHRRSFGQAVTVVPLACYEEAALSMQQQQQQQQQQQHALALFSHRCRHAEHRVPSHHRSPTQIKNYKQLANIKPSPANMSTHANKKKCV